MRNETSELRRDGAAAAIPDLPLPATLRLLVLAPHPDDFDAIGVTLQFFARRGHYLAVAVARTGSGVADDYRPGSTLADKADLREAEQRRSLQFFGLPEDRLTFLRLATDATDQLVDCPANGAALAACVRTTAPDLVFLPHGHDTNCGHQAMGALARQVARQAGRPLVLFLNRDPKTIAMRTDLYLPFGTADATWKAKLLRFHDSQHQRNLRTRGHGFADRLLAVNRESARALALDAEYAEAFELELHPPLPRPAWLPPAAARPPP